jgi:ferredoxin, 2Fe-2S
MPKIKFIKNKPEFEVPAGSNLMKSLLDHGLPVASSCNGDGVCSKCRLKIISGAENLSEPNETELILKEQNDIGKDFRISCQTEVLGDVTVDASYW